MQKQEETMPASAFDAWLPRPDGRGFWEQERQVTLPRVLLTPGCREAWEEGVLCCDHRCFCPLIWRKTERLQVAMDCSLHRFSRSGQTWEQRNQAWALA